MVHVLIVYQIIMKVLFCYVYNCCVFVNVKWSFDLLINWLNVIIFMLHIDFYNTFMKYSKQMNFCFLLFIIPMRSCIWSLWSLLYVQIKTMDSNQNSLHLYALLIESHIINLESTHSFGEDFFMKMKKKFLIIPKKKESDIGK